MSVEIKEIGRKVEKLRTQQRMSLTDLSRAAGRSYPTVWRLERGAGRTVTLETLIEVAKALGVTPASLFPDEPLAEFPRVVEHGLDECLTRVAHFVRRKLPMKSQPALNQSS